MTGTKDKTLNAIAWLMCCVVVSLLAIVVLTQADTREEYQDAAVERGYAEWVLLDDTRGKTEWRWIEPEEVGH